MINKLRNSVFCRFVWGFLAFHLLNICIDNPDVKPNNSLSEELIFNEQESIVEFVIEKLLGYENAIDEYDDHGEDGSSTKKLANIDWVVLPPPLSHKLNRPYTALKKTIPHYIEPYSQVFCKIFTPPPEA